MNKPSFLVVGTQKAGTTSMYDILKNHPEIYIPDTKEIHFFDKNYEKGTAWYFDQFPNPDKKRVIGEVTPNYMYDQNAPQRIYNDLGKNIKLIFIFRNPADRIFSNYKMNVGRNHEQNSFKDAIYQDLEKMKNNEQYPVVFHYVKRGFYDTQLKRFLELFERKNLLFLLFEEDTINNRKKTFEKIYRFLEVENANISVDVKVTPDIAWKSNRIDKILNTAHPINQLIKNFIPSKNLRMKMKYWLMHFNRKPHGDKNELEEMRPFLIDEIYKESIINLEKLIDKDLSAWFNF